MRHVDLKKKFGHLCLAALSFALLLAGNVAAQTTRTWDGLGASGVWSDGGNWGGTAPAAGDNLIFSGTGAQCTNANDLALDTSFAGLTFSSGSRNYLLSGNRITLGGNVANSSANPQRINFDMILDATRTFNMASGGLYANGTLSGTGGLTQTGGNTLYLSGTNTYQGVTTVSGGIIRILSGQALGTVDGGTVVNADKRLELAGVCVTGEVVTINGKGNNNGALQGVSGSNTWAGKVILGSVGENRFGVSSPTAMLVVSGVIEGPSGYHMTVRNADDCGPTILANTNTYKGETQVIVGTLRLSGGDDRLPTNTLVRIGNGSNVSWAQLDLNGCNQTVAGITNYAVPMSQKITNLASNQTATLTVNLSKAYAFSGELDGNLSLVKAGPSNLTLSATSNPFWGQTIVREGELLIERPTGILGSTVNTGDGPMGVLAFGTNAVMNFGGLCGTNNIAMTNRFGAPVHLRVRGNQTTAFDGQITEGSDFTKAGAGYLTLNNANLYTGRTYLLGGTLKVASEESFGAYPSSYVPDQITFDGGTLRTETNMTWAAGNRGMYLAAGGGTLWSGTREAVVTLTKQLTGVGGIAYKGFGVFLPSVSNAYDGVTGVGSISEQPCVLRVADPTVLGNLTTNAVVYTGSQLELANGLVVSKPIVVNGAGNTVEPPPPSSPASNRGALQAAVGATAEWAGPVLLGSNLARLGAQNNGHLIISGVIDDGPATYALRISTNPGDRTRGVEFRAHNTYGGSTDLTRGMLFLGVSDAIPPSSILDVHWASSNNSELSGLDLKGFDQAVSGLRNSGNTGANALITNSTLTVSTLTVSQSADTVYNGTIRGPIALVKDGAGSLTLGYPTRYSGATTVRGGTLALGANDVLSSGSSVVLAGGTVAIGNTTNTLASLTVTADSAINLGEGTLTFNSQTADEWSGQLNLTGTLDPASLRFQPLLSAAQLEHIRYEGKWVMQNAGGYIVPWTGTLLMVF
jgi:autotransporter-associated beta strand protein